MRSFSLGRLSCKKWVFVVWSLSFLHIIVTQLLNISWFRWQRRKSSLLSLSLDQSVSIGNPILENFLLFVMMNQILLRTLSTNTQRTIRNVTFIVTKVFFRPESINKLLKSHPVILLRKPSNSIFNLLSFWILTSHPFPSQSRWNRFHFEKYSVIFLLSLNYFLLCCWLEHWRWLPERSLSRRLRRIPHKRFYFFKFNQKFNITLVYLQIFIIELIRKRFVLTLLYLMQLSIPTMIKMKLSLGKRFENIL